MMAPQDMIDRLTAAGHEIIGLVRSIGDSYLPADVAKPNRDLSMGRDLAMCVFLAAVGDEAVNRIWLIEGFAQAIGESLAQQPPANQNAIADALTRGLADGARLGAELMPAGRA